MSSKLSEIAKTYDYNQATLYEIVLKTDLMLERVQLSEALVLAERGIDLARKESIERVELMFLGYRAEASILLNKIDIAKDSIRQANEIVEQEKFIGPIHIAPYLGARFVINIQILKKATASNDNSNLTSLNKKAYKSGKAALRKFRKYAPYRNKTLRLMGTYYWLIGKQKKALKWWNKSIQEGERLGARPELSRTYMEVGKCLLSSGSKYKELNGITAKEYLKKARTMFEEMDLQWDLDELERISAAN